MFKDFAGCVEDCSTLKYNKKSWYDNRIQMVCIFYKKGWLNQNGTLNNSIRSRYDEIPGVSKNINKCLVLDPVKNQSKTEKNSNKRLKLIDDLEVVFPSRELFEKLQCISFMINNGLDHCLETILKSKNKTIRYDN